MSKVEDKDKEKEKEKDKKKFIERTAKGEVLAFT